MSNVKAKKRGNRWEAFYEFGTYWFPASPRRVVTYATAKAAREAARARRKSLIG